MAKASTTIIGSPRFFSAENFVAWVVFVGLATSLGVLYYTNLIVWAPVDFFVLALLLSVVYPRRISIAGMFSLLWAGSGFIYLRQWKRGLLWLVGGSILTYILYYRVFTSDLKDFGLVMSTINVISAIDLSTYNHLPATKHNNLSTPLQRLLLTLVVLCVLAFSGLIVYQAYTIH